MVFSSTFRIYNLSLISERISFSVISILLPLHKSRADSPIKTSCTTTLRSRISDEYVGSYSFSMVSFCVTESTHKPGSTSRAPKCCSHTNSFIKSMIWFWQTDENKCVSLRRQLQTLMNRNLAWANFFQNGCRAFPAQSNNTFEFVPQQTICDHGQHQRQRCWLFGTPTEFCWSNTFGQAKGSS